MMNDLFLPRAAPLYGRARKLLHVAPLDYAAFCRACRLPADALESFEKFACVGGIPKYWEFVEEGKDVIGLAESLYFDLAPYMEQEPQRILRDEGVSGLNAVAALEAVGRGAERPSEIAARLGTAQTNLSRLLQQLLDASILRRELPFGESVRTTKRSFTASATQRCDSGSVCIRRTKAFGEPTLGIKSKNSSIATPLPCSRIFVARDLPARNAIGRAMWNWIWSRPIRKTRRSCWWQKSNADVSRTQNGEMFYASLKASGTAARCARDIRRLAWP